MVLHQILNDPPPSPRSVNDTIPPDLETICLQAMAQEPRRRYATASDLAADLHRFLKGEAIHACPVSRWQQRWRTLRLKPLTAGLAAAGILLLLGTLVATGLGYVTSLQARRQAEEERDAAARNAREAQAGAEREALSRESLQKKEKEARTTLRAALLGQAQALRQSGLPGGREEALEALRQAARVEPGADLRTEFLRCLTSPGSERDSRVVYSFTTGPRLAKPSVNALEFSPGERWLAFAAEEPTVVDLHNPEYPLPVLHAGSGAAAGLAFGGQDDLLAMIGRSNQSAVVWQIPSPLARPMSPARTPTQAAGVNAVGQALAAGMDKDGVIRIWNFDNGYAGPVAVKVATPREMKHLRIGAGAEQVSFLDKKEDQWLLRIHEASGGSEVYSLPLGRTAPEDYALASQPPYAAVSSPQAIVIYDLRSGSPWQTIKAGGQKVTSIALDDTARVLAAAFANGDVKLWNAASGELLALLPSGLKGVDHIALSRSGRWLVAGDAQGHVRLWDIAGTRRLLSEARLDWATPPLGATAAPAAGTAAAFLEQAQRMHLAGRYQEAADAYGKSLSLAADQSATHRDRGEVFFQLKRYDAAIADFEKARDLAPESAYGPSFIKALQFRALALAEASQWEKSAADLLKAIRHGAEKDLPMGERAVLRLAAGDFAAYGKICDSMLIHLMGKEKVETTHPVVWTIVLAPATLHDYARVQEMAEDSADNHVKNWLYQNALGAVLCRAGQYEAALDRLNRSVNLSDKGGHPRDWLFLAITSYQVAQTNESRKWLEKAERWLAETRAQATDAAGFSERWELLILRREAQKLLHASKPVSGK
jgi:tetratricopeptide (TPR) repeat protein